MFFKLKQDAPKISKRGASSTIFFGNPEFTFNFPDIYLAVRVEAFLREEKVPSNKTSVIRRHNYRQKNQVNQAV